MHLITAAPCRQSGLTLIEVLVAMLMLSVAILAMAATHAAALKYTKVAQFKGIAVQVANDLVDRMRANRNGNYTFTQPYNPDDNTPIVPPSCSTANCTPQDIADLDLGEIRLALRRVLPGGGLRVVTPNPGIVDIFIIWQTPDAPGSDADSSAAMMPCPAVIGGPASTQCLSVRAAL